MATKRASSEWWAYLGDGTKAYSAEEMALVEAMLLREVEQARLAEARQQTALLGQMAAWIEQTKHHAARADGRLERLELFLARKDRADYPLAQLNEPDYRAFRRAVTAYEHDRDDILNGNHED